MPPPSVGMQQRAPTLPANVKWFGAQKRRAGNRRRSPNQLVALRLHDLARVFRARSGVVLPDDDSGRDDLLIAAHHLASLSKPRQRIKQWIELWAPWLTVAELRAITTDAIMNQRHWTADQLAWRLRLTKEERRMLGITTIGAIDEAKAARIKARRERDRKRKLNARRAEGAKPRRDYETASINRTKPWIAEGISRRTWYRRRGTTPATP